MKNRQICALAAAIVLSLTAAGCGSSGTAVPAESSLASSENTAEGKEASPQKDSSLQEDGSPASDNSSQEDSSAGSTAPAADSTGSDSGFVPEDSQLSDDGSVIEFPEVGVSFQLPESFKSTKGFLPNGGGEIVKGDGVYCMYYNYVALNEEDYNKLLVAYRSDEANSQKYEDFFNPRVLGMFSVYAADKNRNAEEIGAYLKKLYEERGIPLSDDNPLEGAELIGTVGEYNFYYLDETKPDTKIEEDSSEFSDDYDLTGFNEEYAALVRDVKNTCTGLMTFSEPEKSESSGEADNGESSQ